jgi:hypothetical protein
MRSFTYLLLALFTALLVYFTHTKHAQGMELRKATWEVGRIYNKRDPQFADDYTLRQRPTSGTPWQHHLGLGLNTNFITLPGGSLYLDQEVIGRSTTSQYREVWWEWDLGINIHAGSSGAIEIFHHHKSEHAMDMPGDNYPLEDYYGVRFCFFGNACKK